MKKIKSCWSATVEEIFEQVPNSGKFDLTLSLPKSFKAKPGQFILLPPLDKKSILPRPFSITELGYTNSHTGVSIWLKVVGKNSRLYSKLRYGDKITVLGPKGSPIKIGREKKYILVAGGMGLAGLVFLAKELLRQGKKVIILAGDKKKTLIPSSYLSSFLSGPKIKTIGDKSGFVTDLLIPILKEDGGQARVVACGKREMLEKVAEISANYGNECEVIVEEVMACGTSSCKGCAIFGKDKTVKHVCSDGPAFDAKWIDWPKFIRRSIQPAPKSTAKKPLMSIGLGVHHPIFLHSPLLNASGCFGIEALERGDIDLTYVGALETKGVTVQPRVGNAMPRICEVDDGIINSIGLENVGLKEFVSKELPRWLKFDKPVLVNISGFSFEEYQELAWTVGKTPIDGIVVNISCPNIKGGGIYFGADARLAEQITKTVRRAAPNKFIVVKLTPNVTDIASIALAVRQAGADAISLVNTFQAIDIDVATRRPKIGAIIGGLSGSAIAPIALRMTYQLRQERLGIPLIVMGGIENAETAAKFIMLGADALAIGTGSFGRPHIFTEVFRGLEKIAKQHGFGSLAEMTGSLITD